MARQKGIIPISGRIGNLVYLQGADGNYCRSAAGPYEQSEGSKKAANEFGTCSTASKMVRNAFADYLLSSFRKDPKNRLSVRFQQVVRSGPREKLGLRGIVDGNVGLITGFEFNHDVALERFIAFKPCIEQEQNQIKLVIPEFAWTKVNAPKKAGALILGTAWGFFDFRNGYFESAGAGELIQLQNKVFAGACLEIPIPQWSEQVFLTFITVSFLSSAKHGGFRIEDKKYQAGKIVSAIHLRNGEAVIFKSEQKVLVQKKKEITPDISWKMTVSTI